MTVSFAFSPCPNDIFLFRAFLDGFSNETNDNLTIADISILNQLALNHSHSIVKISAALFPRVSNNYGLMSVGNILGHGIGPLVLSWKGNSILTSIATPGDTTTAHALCRLFYPEAHLVPMPYHKVISAVLNKLVDGCVVIHEERFSYDSRLCIHNDLGKLWERKTGLPVPLGCLVYSKSLSAHLVSNLELDIKQSLDRSLKDIDISIKVAAKYARNKHSDTIQKFIDTYVNEETLCLSELGKKSFNTLWNYIDASFSM
ncbi:menaquinone biosynthesis family protein [Chlamydia ibidis]|uniref:Menaquinone biosynthesis family protein n=2 Tax=Chlamydia ibidis TaxID=1405396 RepID=S7J4A7_9CHLA|nr:MqnA/MqnD/SBP family protein [Chlamydia ibidis]EPP35068.1 menaquinone biosynthesis family protein [Chlamydia ibidis]EQM62576.1 hypothetical protein H359_0731 [Chlamydia ibidis 10-1398/6]